MTEQMQRVKRIELTPVEGRELKALVARDQTKSGHARRARVILLSADGLPCREIANRLSLSLGQVSRIRGRFERGGVTGLADRPRAGRKDHAVPREKSISSCFSRSHRRRRGMLAGRRGSSASGWGCPVRRCPRSCARGEGRRG